MGSKIVGRLSLLILFVYANDSLAFNWHACKQAMWVKHKYGYGFLIGETAVSSSSYISSTGECAALGLIEARKQQFIAFNLDKIKVDSARGAGEYIEAYASLSGCPSDSRIMFSALLKRNYLQIYGQNEEQEPEKIYTTIDEIIKSDPILSSVCNLDS